MYLLTYSEDGRCASAIPSSLYLMKRYLSSYQFLFYSYHISWVMCHDKIIRFPVHASSRYLKQNCDVMFMYREKKDWRKERSMIFQEIYPLNW